MERQELIILTTRKLGRELKDIASGVSRKQEMLSIFKDRLAQMPEGESLPSLIRGRENLLSQIDGIQTYLDNSGIALEMIALVLELLDKEARRLQKVGPMLPGLEDR